MSQGFKSLYHPRYSFCPAFMCGGVASPVLNMRNGPLHIKYERPQIRLSVPNFLSRLRRYPFTENKHQQGNSRQD